MPSRNKDSQTLWSVTIMNRIVSQSADREWNIELVGPRLRIPALPSARWNTVYGYGSWLQVSPTHVAAIVNRRVTGEAVVDFEDGTDALVCDHPDQLDPRNAVPLSRSEPATHPVTGRKLHTRCIMLTGGFVPLGARLPDGRPHPAAGTGFVFGAHGSCLAEPRPHRADAANAYGFRELIQLRYDGRTLSVTDRLRLQGAEIDPRFLRVGHGLSNALPDGADLLGGVTAGPVAPGAIAGSPCIPTEHPHGDDKLGRNFGSCFCRWRHGPAGWRPVEIVPVSGPDLAMEPTLIRDSDGALLMAVRGKGLKEPAGAVHDGLENTYEHFRVYRSTENGRTWTSVLHLPRMRNATPVVLNRSAGGRPFITANPYQAGKDSQGRTIPSTHWRNKLHLWPLTADRSQVEQPICLLDADQTFGAPRAPAGAQPMTTDNIWNLDHPIASTVRLADGRWHCLLGFRVSDRGVNEGGLEAADPAGFWTGEITVHDETPLPLWRFAAGSL